MTLAALLPLIIQYGLPFAETVWRKAQSSKEVTQADWDELNQLAAQTPQTHLAGIAARAGVPMTDPRIVAIAELIK